VHYEKISYNQYGTNVIVCRLPFFLFEVDVIISELNPVSLNVDIEPDAFADTSSAEITRNEDRYINKCNFA